MSEGLGATRQVLRRLPPRRRERRRIGPIRTRCEDGGLYCYLPSSSPNASIGSTSEGTLPVRAHEETKSTGSLTAPKGLWPKFESLRTSVGSQAVRASSAAMAIAVRPQETSS